jgi:ribosome recycling factor
MSASESENIIKSHSERCSHTEQAFKKDLQKVRTGKASSAVLEGIVVDYYGSKTQLSHLAQISTPDARTIMVQVFDSSAVAAIEKAILNSGLGLNPGRDGNALRMSVPPLTAETRKDIVKHLHKSAEEVRVSIRNHRRDANDSLKSLEKDNLIGKDEIKKYLDRVQKQTDDAIKKIDEMLQAKERECMEV